MFPFALRSLRLGTSDRYEVEERIASGGMATVWLATDRELLRRVVIKRLHSHFAGDSHASERFEREARAAASLSHPGLVKVFDVGEDELGRYIVMEYVEGETLGDLLQREGPLAPSRAAHIVAAVAEALDHAHRHRLIHRDVKPSNILIDGDGRARLGDFGIARSLEATHDLTGTETLMGTVGYLAPERASGHDATSSSDIYSLGVVLYQALTGVPPFSGESPVAVAVAHLTSSPEPPSRLAPVPPDLEAIVEKAMAKDPSERHASAGEMAQVLRGWLAESTSDHQSGSLRDSTLANDRLAPPPPVGDPQLDSVVREALSSAPERRPDASSPATRLRASSPTRSIARFGGSTVEMSTPDSVPEAAPISRHRPRRWWIIGLALVLAALMGYALGVGDDRTPATDVNTTLEDAVAETSTTAVATTVTTAQSEEASLLRARSDLEAALAAAPPNRLNPNEARDVMEKVDQAIEFIDDGKSGEASSKLREAADRIEEELSGEIENDAVDALTRLATALGLSLGDNDD